MHPTPTPTTDADTATTSNLNAATDVDLKGTEDEEKPTELLVAVDGFRAISYKVGQRFKIGVWWWEVVAVRSEPAPMMVIAPRQPGAEVQQTLQRKRRGTKKRSRRK